jgi:hypothetical protein
MPYGMPRRTTRTSVNVILEWTLKSSSGDDQEESETFQLTETRNNILDHVNRMCQSELFKTRLWLADQKHVRPRP